MRFFVAGDLMLDVLTFLDDDIRFADDNRASIEFAGGGVCANVASWMVRSGEQPVLYCAVGRDVIGDALVSELQLQGVEVRASRTDAPTGAVVALVHSNGERTMFPSAGANLQLPADVLDDALAAGDHLHLSGYFILREHSRAIALHFIEVARSKGCTVSIDAASARLIEVMGPAAALQAMQGVDLLLCNEQEAKALAAVETTERAAQALAGRFTTAIVKLGSRGACSWVDGVLVSDPAIPGLVASTVGAGDAFDAAAIVAWKQGLSLHRVLAAGNKHGHLAVQQRGARPA